MEMASFWLEEKQLVHKLFKVLAPRFKDYQIAYTALYRAPKHYPEEIMPFSVLELRGDLHFIYFTFIVIKSFNKFFF